MRWVLVSFAVLASIGCSSVEGQPVAAASGAEGGTLFVANKRGNSLSRIDLTSGAETNRVDTCANPHELAVSPDKRHVAVVCYNGSGLEVYSAADLALAKRIELGEDARPHGLVWHPSGMIVATAERRGSLFVVADPLSDQPALTEIVSGEPGGRFGPHLAVVDAEGRYAWGTIIPRSTVVRYDLREGKVAGEVVLAGDTEGIALSPDGSQVWVGSNTGNRAYRLAADTLAVEDEVPTGTRPIRVAAHPSGDWVVTSNLGDGALSVIDTASGEVARTIAVSGRQAGLVTLAFSGDGSRLYAAETMADTVAEIDFETGKVLRRLPAGDGGDGLAVVD